MGHWMDKTHRLKETKDYDSAWGGGTFWYTVTVKNIKKAYAKQNKLTTAGQILYDNIRNFL
jgi:hypothetical protein